MYNFYSFTCSLDINLSSPIWAIRLLWPERFVFLYVSSHKVRQHHHHQLQWCMRLGIASSFVCPLRKFYFIIFDSRIWWACVLVHTVFFVSCDSSQFTFVFGIPIYRVFSFSLENIYKYKSWAEIKETNYERVIDSVVGISQHFLGMRIKWPNYAHFVCKVRHARNWMDISVAIWILKRWLDRS